MQSPDRLIKPVMVISGVMTLTMLYAAFAPQAALQGMFGDTLSGPVAEIVVRNWGALAAIGGATLIWGTFHPEVRAMVLLAVGGSKAIFILLVLIYGRSFLSRQAGIAVAIDAVWVIVFALVLIRTRRP